MSDDPARDPRRVRPTMHDVAALAGVALKTVSRVMNGVPTVDPELAAKVRDAAQKLGYRPNIAAGNLRRAGGRTNTLGLLVEDVSNPFSASLHRAVENVASERGVLLLTASLDGSAAREYDLARTLIDRRVDGLIIVPSASDHRWVVAEQQAGTVFVFLDRQPTPLIADAIVSDNRAAAARGVAHLVAHGHRRIAYLGDEPTIATARLRYQGYCDALAEAGLAADPTLVISGLRTVQRARSAALGLLDLDPHPPTAILASQNFVTTGAIHALRERGLQRTIALLGYDDIVLADLLEPAITVVAQDPVAMGRLAADCLFRRLDGDLRPAEVYTVETRLIARGSGEIRA